MTRKTRVTFAFLRLSRWRRRLRKLINLGIYKTFYKLPKKNYVVFESHRGISCQCNPRSIFEELKNHGSANLIWSVRKLSVAPADSTPVRRGGVLYTYYLARARVWVQNGEFAGRPEKSNRTLYINTQHGTPLKKLGNDIHFAKYRKGNRAWDVVLSENAYMEEKLKSAFNIKNSARILTHCYPRNDVFYKQNDITQLKVDLGLPQDKLIIFYAPTYRGYHKNFQFDSFFNEIPDEIYDRCAFIFRGHHLNGAHRHIDKVYNCTDPAIDVQKLCLVSDILITDYSSVMFDFLHQKKLVVHYFLDYEIYNSVRGLYFNIRDNPLGPIINRPFELLKIIVNYASVLSDAKAAIENYYESFCAGHDRSSAATICGIISEALADVDDRPDLFLYVLFWLQGRKKGVSDWLKHGFVPALARTPSLVVHKRRFVSDVSSYSRMTELLEGKSKLLIIGCASHINDVSRDTVNKLRQNGTVVIGLNRACRKFDVDITLWADNLAISDITAAKSIKQSTVYVKVGCHNLKRKKLGSRYWAKHRNFDEWEDKHLFMSRTILTSALFLAFRYRIRRIGLVGVDLETRNYFDENLVLHDIDKPYEAIDDYFIQRDHVGYTSQKIVKEVIEYLVREGFAVTSLHKNAFLSRIAGLDFIAMEEFNVHGFGSLSGLNTKNAVIEKAG